MKATNEFFNQLREEIKSGGAVVPSQGAATSSSLSNDLDTQIENLSQSDYEVLMNFSADQWFFITGGFEKEYAANIIRKFDDKQAKINILGSINDAYKMYCCPGGSFWYEQQGLSWYGELSAKIMLSEARKSKKESHEGDENKTIQEKIAALEKKNKMLEDENKALKGQQVRSEGERVEYQEILSQQDKKDEELKSALSREEKLEEEIASYKEEITKLNTKLAGLKPKSMEFPEIDRYINFRSIVEALESETFVPEERLVIRNFMMNLIGGKNVPEDIVTTIKNFTSREKMIQSKFYIEQFNMRDGTMVLPDKKNKKS